MMVAGVFDRFQDALSAVSELVESGFPPKSLSLMARSDCHKAPDATANGLDSVAVGLSDTFEAASVDCGSGTKSVWANGPLAAALHNGAASGNGAFLGALAGAGLPRTTAWYFVDSVCAGNVLLSVHCEESRARDARDILDGHSTPVTAAVHPELQRGTRHNQGRPL